MHRISVLLTECFISKRWIDAEDQNWCIYAIETKLLAIVFFCAIAVLAVMLNILPQTIIFTFTFYHLRRRIGGYHAPYAWLCQFVSVGVVFCVTLLIGPALERVPLAVFIPFNMLVLISALIKQPVYPPQTHFDSEVVTANNKKKNVLILLITVMQIAFGYFYLCVVVYTFLGVLTGLISVYIEMIRQKIKEDHYEESGISRRENCQSVD